MDQGAQKMVEKFKKILDKIEKNKGKVTLFMIMKMDELIDKWTVVLSAPWVNVANQSDDFQYLRTLLVEELNQEERNSIARIGIFPKNAHIVDLFLDYKEESEIKEQSVNGYIIHDAYIFASNRSV